MPQESDIRDAVRAMFGRRKKEEKRPASAAMPEYHPSTPYDPSQSPRQREEVLTPPKRTPVRARRRATKRRG